MEFEFQRYWGYHVDLRQSGLAFKLKFVRGRGYETYNSKEVKKEHKEEAETDDEKPGKEKVQEAPVFSLLM